MADQDKNQDLTDHQTKAKQKLKGIASTLTAFCSKKQQKDILEAGTMPLEPPSEEESDKDNSLKVKSIDDLQDLDPVTLAELGTRRGSRFSADGTPLFLKAFLESASPSLNFQFHFRHDEKKGFLMLEEECDRRVMGKKMRYEMFEGDFRIPDGYKQPTMAEGSRYRISDIYHLQIDPEIVAFVGIMPGWRAPVITDGNPHQDGLIDHHRLVYLPYSEDKNLVMELPNSPGLFFTSQIISGGEFIVAFDKTMHKYWVISINQVYTPSKYPRNSDWNLQKSKFKSEDFDEISWRRAIENQAYCDRVVQLLTRFGNNLEILLRIVPTSQFFHLLESHEDDDKKHPSQARLDNYFRDEIITSKDKIRHFYYEKEAMVYGFYEDGNWKFGLKDRGRNNGYAIKMNSLDALYVENVIAQYPL